MVTVQGASAPVVRNVMTLNTCAPIVGAEVMSFDTWVARQNPPGGAGGGSRHGGQDPSALQNIPIAFQ